MLAIIVLFVVAAAAACGGSDPAGDAGAGGTTRVTLLAAGDIAECETNGDEQTAALLAEYPKATIATLGDNAYQHGTSQEFEACYGPSWGRFRDRTHPATGNHDYATKDAEGFHEYFGDRGGPFDRYYYSYDLGAWHVVVLNSDCWRVGGCGAGDDQISWLRDDLEEHRAQCTLAYWHRPPFSSGRYGDPEATDRVRPLWRVVVDAGVELVLVGHEHSYERFAPMNAEGDADPDGTQLIVAGTGGGNLRRYERPPLPTTEIRNDEAWGVLKLTLRAGGYDWRFLPVAGKTFTDAGSRSCR